MKFGYLLRPINLALLLFIWVLYLLFIPFPSAPCPGSTVAPKVYDECHDLLTNFASKCDVRLHFLGELQDYRKRIYDELGLTTSEPIRMLFYSLEFYWNRHMDRWWFFRYEAAKRNPFIEAVLWGTGFPNYRDEETLKQNIERVYKSATYFHVINVLLWQKKYLPELTELSNTSAIMEMHDESWCISGDDCKDKQSHVNLINASLVGFAYAYEMLKPEWQEVGLRRHFFHIPKTVGAEYFYRPPDPNKASPKTLEEAVARYDRERDIDVLLISAVHQRVYPLRWKVTCMYKSGYFDHLPYKFFYQGHPGYKQRTDDPFNYSMAMEQINNYASLMRRSKIVVTDSSRYHYAVGKYAEIPTSGALILADIPDERELDFNLFVARINNNMQPKEIVETIKFWLENPVKRYQRARLGQILTLQKYTNDHSTDIMVQAYLNYKKNKIGTFYPFPFSDTCRATSPIHMSRYCFDGDEKDDANEVLTPDKGWYLAPNNCSAVF